MGGAIGKRRSAAGRAKWNVDPAPGVDSTHIRPPCHSMAFLQNASPSPLPGCSLPCRRLNTPKIRAWNAGSMPGPLSRTENTHSGSWRLEETCTAGGCASKYSMAFPDQMVHDLGQDLEVPATAGKGSCVTIAARSIICFSVNNSA